ncbi:MAG: Oxidoreductase, short chain dehydrogenase/reductase family [Labilithrix sp.]|nr:Oxidoreductase, short chain dehydrogenase/reductase family [Labilithrix sp.]
MSDKRIFVTGGASGFGRALAERWARAGYRVCIGDIHEQRLEETLKILRGYGVTAHALRCDVTKDEDLAAAARWLQENWGGVDVVVNNAGVAVGGGITETTMDDWRWIVDINLLGVVRGCRTFTPLFRKQGSGRFVNVASLAGLVHAPMMSAYNATKAAVVALSETLAVELADDGIMVSVVCPSFFRTNLTETMRAGTPDVAALTDKLVNKSKFSADEIADLTFRSVQRGEMHVLPHTEAKAAWAAKRALPFSMFLTILKKSTARMMGKKARA